MGEILMPGESGNSIGSKGFLGGFDPGVKLIFIKKRDG
jgi:hypothetical protein